MNDRMRFGVFRPLYRERRDNPSLALHRDLSVSAPF